MFKDISFSGGFYVIMNYLDYMLYGFSEAIILEQRNNYTKFLCKEIDGKHSRIIIVQEAKKIQPIVGW